MTSYSSTKVSSWPSLKLNSFWRWSFRGHSRPARSFQNKIDCSDLPSSCLWNDVLASRLLSEHTSTDVIVLFIVLLILVCSAWLLCYATAVGCQSNSASSTSCVWRYIAACTATHHLTWRTWSRRRPLQLSDLVSDLPHPVQLQCHELYRRSETGPSRLQLAHVHGTNVHHRVVAFTSPDTFKRQLKTFLYNHAFNLHC